MGLVSVLKEMGKKAGNSLQMGLCDSLVLRIHGSS